MQTILIVDREAGFMHAVQTVLQQAGYSVLSAVDSEEALRLLNEHQTSLILMEDALEGISGGRLCMMLKHDPLYRHIPVVMHTAGVRVLNPDYVRKIGADAVLHKPSPPAALLETISHLLQSTSRIY